MPVSRIKTRMVWCPGCNLRCWAGMKRLLRHMRNQCRSQATRERAAGNKKDYGGRYFQHRRRLYE